MPFVIVGYPYSFVNLKAEFIDSALWTTGFLYEYNWRNYLYDHVSLIRSKNLDFSKLLAVKDFVSYVMNKIELSFDDLHLNFFKWNESEEGNDIEVLSWEIETWNVVEEVYTWEYEPVQNYESSWDPFAWLLQPSN
jgi:hypothetical protein